MEHRQPGRGAGHGAPITAPVRDARRPSPAATDWRLTLHRLGGRSRRTARRTRRPCSPAVLARPRGATRCARTRPAVALAPAARPNFAEQPNSRVTKIVNRAGGEILLDERRAARREPPPEAVRDPPRPTRPTTTWRRFVAPRHRRPRTGRVAGPAGRVHRPLQRARELGHRPAGRRRAASLVVRLRERRSGTPILRARQGVHRRRRLDDGRVRQHEPPLVDPRLRALLRRPRRDARPRAHPPTRPGSATAPGSWPATPGSRLWREHLGRTEATGDDDLVDPDSGFDAFRASARARCVA